MRRWIDLGIALLLAALVSVPTRAVDTLTAARDLYAAAEYENALNLLDRLQPDDHAPDERRAIAQYRAYCLLALGRPADAEQAIAAVVSAMPLYKPTGADASPRVRTAFSTVRRRMLPSIIQEKYASAKAAFDRKDFAGAEMLFGEVVDATGDTDLGELTKQPPLADLRTLATGFRDLARSAAVPPPIEARPSAVSPAAPTLVAPTFAPPPMPRIYAPQDQNVVPPVAIKQSLPGLDATELGLAKPGLLEIVIAENGSVETAAMRESVSIRYDRQLLDSARRWQYKPATIRGVPVKYRKLIQVKVTR